MWWPSGHSGVNKLKSEGSWCSKYWPQANAVLSDVFYLSIQHPVSYVVEFLSIWVWSAGWCRVVTTTNVFGLGTIVCTWLTLPLSNCPSYCNGFENIFKLVTLTTAAHWLVPCFKAVLMMSISLLARQGNIRLCLWHRCAGMYISLWPAEPHVCWRNNCLQHGKRLGLLPIANGTSVLHWLNSHAQVSWSTQYWQFLSWLAHKFFSGAIGLLTAGVAVLWSSLSASKLFVTALDMSAQQPLVAYPCSLVYGLFALLAVF